MKTHKVGNNDRLHKKMDKITDRFIYTERVGYFKLTANNLSVVESIIAKYQPDTILDIGCGTGMLMNLMSRLPAAIHTNIKGCRLSAVAKDGYLCDKNSLSGMIAEEDMSTFIPTNRTENTLFILSWPPYDSAMASIFYDTISVGDVVIYVGEGMGGCTADDDFHQAIRNDIVATHSIDTWDGIYDRITVLKKN